MVARHSLYSLLPYRDFFLVYSKPRVAYAFYKNKTLDLITGQELGSGITELSRLMMNPIRDHLIFHAFYELGYLFTHGVSHVPDDTMLGIWVEYDELKKYSHLGEPRSVSLSSWEHVDEETYAQAFATGQKHLLRGDCYQYNLTYPFRCEYTGRALDIARRLWKKQRSRGHFASFTHSGCLQKSFLSNSPECLFQIDDKTISSMPIKGTVASTPKTLKANKKLLASSLKNESELYMITDLIKNDLNWLSGLKAYVDKKKAFLEVPGLLHTYSSISAPLSQEVLLWDVMSRLFPGGSITGAPKKRSVEILRGLEKEVRGFYCGSTIVKSNKLFAASINIRSCVIDEQNSFLTYHAGSGITLESTYPQEFEEMNLKLKSFTLALNF